MIETKEKMIQEYRVEVTQLPGRKALALSWKLKQILGPVLGSFADGGESILDSNVDLVVAIEKVFDQVNEDTAFALMQRILLSTVMFKGSDKFEASKEEVFDSVFGGDLALMYKVVGFTLEVNFKSFLGGKSIGDLINKVKTLVPSKQPAA